MEHLDIMAGPHWPTFREDPTHWAARNALAEIYLPLAQRAARAEHAAAGDRHRARACCDEGDLHQLAYLCLVDLFRSYDPGLNGGSFVKYAAGYLRLRIKAAVRSQSFVTRWAMEQGINPMMESLDSDPMHQGGAIRLLSSPRQDDAAEAADFAEWLAGRLPSRLAEIFRLRFLKGLTNVQIAERMGVVDSRISQIIHHQLIPALAHIIGDAPAGLKDRLSRLASHRVPPDKAMPPIEAAVLTPLREAA